MSAVTKNSLFFAALSFFISCGPSKILDKKANEIAGLECRAISLREQRFALANQFRFTQDSLLHLTSSADSAHLIQEISVYTSEKNKLLQQSLQLADTIHLALDSLRKYVFTSPDDKKLFDQKLKNALKERGCQGE